MKRLIRLMLYVLGFSVFCACTTTKMTPIDETRVSYNARNLVLTLTDGSTLTVASASVGPENIHGAITTADSGRVAGYFQTWQSARVNENSMNGASTRIDAYSVVIPRSDVRTIQEQVAEGSVPLMIGSTILLGGAGFLLGAAAGLGLVGDCRRDFCELTAAVIGGFSGITVGTATGAHLGNRQRGSFALDLWGGAVGVGAGVAILSIDPDNAPFFVLGALPAIAGPVVAETWSARRRSQERRVNVAVAPAPQGLALSLRLKLND